MRVPKYDPKKINVARSYQPLPYYTDKIRPSDVFIYPEVQPDGTRKSSVEMQPRQPNPQVAETLARLAGIMEFMKGNLPGQRLQRWNSRNTPDFNPEDYKFGLPNRRY